MTAAALLWPAVAQAAVIGLTYVGLGVVRRLAVLQGRADSTDFPPGGEPADSAAFRRLLANHYELPVLFFAVIGYLILIDALSAFAVWVAWAFVASRLVHAFGALRGPLWLRHLAFTIGSLLVAALWLSLVVRIW